jgi:2-iminoacetate synthase ThiH
VAPKPQNKTKKDLANEFSIPGLVLDPSKFNLEKLQEMASAQSIPLQKIMQNIEAGWVGKQKGLLQVLWECGWIDLLHLDEYVIIEKDYDWAVDKELASITMQNGAMP